MLKMKFIEIRSMAGTRLFIHHAPNSEYTYSYSPRTLENASHFLVHGCRRMKRTNKTARNTSVPAAFYSFHSARS